MPYVFLQTFSASQFSFHSLTTCTPPSSYIDKHKRDEMTNTRMLPIKVPDKDSPRFLDLPAELRLEIYSYVFEERVVYCHIPPPKEGPTVACKSTASTDCALSVAILQTCSEAYTEAKPILIAHTTFTCYHFIEYEYPNDAGPDHRTMVLDWKRFGKTTYHVLPALDDMRKFECCCRISPVNLLSPRAGSWSSPESGNLRAILKSALSLLKHNIASKDLKIHVVCRQHEAVKWYGHFFVLDSGLLKIVVEELSGVKVLFIEDQDAISRESEVTDEPSTDLSLSLTRQINSKNVHSYCPGSTDRP